MSLAVKEDEAPGPVDVTVLGAARIMADAEDVTELFEESGRRGLWQFTEMDAEKPVIQEHQRCASLRQGG